MVAKTWSEYNLNGRLTKQLIELAQHVTTIYLSPQLKLTLQHSVSLIFKNHILWTFGILALMGVSALALGSQKNKTTKQAVAHSPGTTS